MEKKINHKIYELFPTIVIGFDFTKHANSTLVDTIRSMNTREHVLVVNGQSSYGGADQNLKHVPELSDFFTDVQIALDTYTDKTGLEPCVVTDSWFNIIGQDGKVTPHRHEGSVISGAFYPYAESGSCSLFFETPLRPFKMNDILAKETTYGAGQIEFPCQPGMLVLFPSWLLHYTERNKTDERITISFNTMRSSLKQLIKKELLNG